MNSNESVIINSDHSNLSEIAQTYLNLLLNNPNSNNNVKARLDSLRKLILLESIPISPPEAQLIRPLLWKVLLNLHLLPPHSTSSISIHPLLNSETYISLTNRNIPSPMFNKIKNDTFRTLAKDNEFLNKVGEDKLIRCLEAFVFRRLDAASESGESPLINETLYVQGMNVLSAPFLFVMPSQMEAFACFTSFIEVQAPRYVKSTLEGVHDGLQLVDTSLKHLDPTLYSHLLAHNLTAELYAFPSILTFSCATPPLKEVIELWDFLLAFGCGLNVLCVVAQLEMMRDELLGSNSPMKLLRTFPPLKTREIIPLVVQFVADLPFEIYDRIVEHPWKG